MGSMQQIQCSPWLTLALISPSTDPVKINADSDAGQQTKEIKPGKERSLEEEESQRREERRVRRCKICNFH